MDIGKCIKELRKSKGITQNELALKIGVSQNAIYQWEEGRRNPKLDRIISIAIALNEDPASFISNIINGHKQNEISASGLTINVILDNETKMPTKAHLTDAGFDIYAPCSISIKPKGSAFVDTGVHFEIPSGYVGMIKSKSGLNCNFGINTEGVIDSGYTGSVGLKLYNHSDLPVYIEEGNKLTQIVFLPIPDVRLVEVDSFEETDRGNGGFGSTGV